MATTIICVFKFVRVRHDMHSLEQSAIAGIASVASVNRKQNQTRRECENRSENVKRESETTTIVLENYNLTVNRCSAVLEKVSALG